MSYERKSVEEIEQAGQRRFFGAQQGWLEENAKLYWEADDANKRADRAEYLALLFAAVCVVECLIIAVLI